MGFVMKQECNCCQKTIREFNKRLSEGKMPTPREKWHCEDCWNRHHNGKRDNDYISEEDAIKRGLI